MPTLTPPAVADVGTFLIARTKDANGNELGTFTTATRPTAAQVTALIQTVADDVGIELGTDVPTDLAAAAQRVIALGTAILVELSYFPEQVARGQSPVEQYQALYDARKAALLKAAVEESSGDTPGALDEPALAIGSFPTDAAGLVGWGTVW